MRVLLDKPPCTQRSKTRPTRTASPPPSIHAQQQKQYQGAAVPVPTLASRRLEVALQHIHKGFVSFPVLKASHLPTTGDHALLRVDYDGVQVRVGK